VSAVASTFSLAKVPAPSVSADVNVEIVRNDARRLRVGKVSVTLHTGLAADDPALAGCLATFEDFCIVTQSVRQGIDVTVQVAGPPEAV
jgi:organic hydroperoxide reductase OsmC/OhrA